MAAVPEQPAAEALAGARQCSIDASVPFAVLGSSVLNPTAVLNRRVHMVHHPRMSVPRQDASLCTDVSRDFPLQPHHYEHFLEPGMPGYWKVHSIVDPAPLMGTMQRSGMLQVKGACAEMLQRSGHTGPCTFAYAYRERTAAFCEAFPLSVTLQLDDNLGAEQKDERSAMRTLMEKDLFAPVYQDNVWPRAIKGYRPMSLHDNDPVSHYRNVILYEPRLRRELDLQSDCSAELDPHFPTGLFGHFRNGLSVVIRALAHSTRHVAGHIKRQAAAAAAEDTAGTHEKVVTILCDYIISVSLQFWLLVRRRWLEVDPDQLLRGPATAAANNMNDNSVSSPAYMPSYIFYWHHQSDFNAKDFRAEAESAQRVKAAKRKTQQNDSEEEAVQPAAAATKKRKTSQAPSAVKVEMPSVKLEQVHEVDQQAAAAAAAEDELAPLKQWAQLARGPQCTASFASFALSVLNYAVHRVEQLAEHYQQGGRLGSIEQACWQLKQCGFTQAKCMSRVESITKNHENFFECMSIKPHRVHDMANKINRWLFDERGKDGPLVDSRTKFYARNNHNRIKVHSVKHSYDKSSMRLEAGERYRYGNPRFWSHLTLLPDAPLVHSELDVLHASADTVDAPPGQRHSEDFTGVHIHQACVLRRLMFVVNSVSAKHIEQHVFSRLLLEESDRGMRVRNTRTRQGYTFFCMEGRVFRSRFVATTSKKDESSSRSSATGRRQLMQRPLYMPPVLPAATLRYCLLIDGDVGRPFVSAICRDVPSMPFSDESDITSIPPPLWLALHHKHAQQAVFGKKELLQAGFVVERKEAATALLPQQLQAAFDELGAPVQVQAGMHYVALTPDCKLLMDGSCVTLTSGQREQLLRLYEGRQSARQFQPADMWYVLTQVCLHESIAVRAYVAHAVRRDIDDVSVDDSTLRLVLQDLQGEWRCRLQQAYLWVRAALDEHQPMRHLLRKVDSVWDRCTPPKCSAEDVGDMYAEQTALDTAFMGIEVYHAHSSVSSSVSTPGLQKLISEAVRAAVINPAGYGLTAEVRARDLDVSKTSASAEPPPVSHMVVTCAVTDADDFLVRKFAVFFGVPVEEDGRSASMVIQGSYLGCLVMFFLWYCYTSITRSMFDARSLLHPDTSVIKQAKSDHGAVTWLEHLTPADPLPRLSSQLSRMLTHAHDGLLFKEMKDALAQKVHVSEHAEFALQALQMALRGRQDSSETGNMNTDLEHLSTQVDLLLQRRHQQHTGRDAEEAAPAFVLEGVSGSRRMAEKKWAQVFSQCVVNLEEIPLPVVDKAFVELAPLLSQGADAMVDCLTRVLAHTYGLLRSNTSANNMEPMMTKQLKAWMINPSNARPHAYAAAAARPAATEFQSLKRLLKRVATKLQELIL